MRLNFAQAVTFVITMLLGATWGWFSTDMWGVPALLVAVLGGALIGVVSGIIVSNLE